MRESVMTLFRVLLRGAEMLNIRINFTIDVKKVAVALFSLALVWGQLLSPDVSLASEPLARLLSTTHEKPVTVALDYLTVTTTRADAKNALASTYAKYFDPQTVAFLTEYSRGVSMVQWKCLNTLWTEESHFNPKALNMSSHAYGIAQFLPTTWANYNLKKAVGAVDQVKDGLRYIQSRYGSPCGALSFHNVHGWY